MDEDPGVVRLHALRNPARLDEAVLEGLEDRPWFSESAAS